MRDTSPIAQARYTELLRAQTPAQRLERAVGLTTASRQLAIADIVARYPKATAAEIRATLAARLYGRVVAERLFPGLALDSR